MEHFAERRALPSKVLVVANEANGLPAATLVDAAAVVQGRKVLLESSYWSSHAQHLAMRQSGRGPRLPPAYPVRLQVETASSSACYHCFEPVEQMEGKAGAHFDEDARPMY